MEKFTIYKDSTARFCLIAVMDCAYNASSPATKMGLAVRWAYWNSTSLSEASLIGADLRCADLRKTDMTGVDLRGADMSNVRMGPYRFG